MQKQRLFIKGIIILTTLLVSNVSFSKQSDAFGKLIKNNNITETEIQSAQEEWGKALIQISEEYEKNGIKKATKLAEKILDAAYGYNIGPVLFKPTLTHGEKTFRTTKEGALAYFVGNNKNFPDDKGFALKGWKKYEYINAAVYINGDLAITMGNVFLTDTSGKVIKVDKTWGFKKDNDGSLKIVLHHSSLPFDPNK